MLEIKGEFNTAVCFTDSLEKESELQIKAVCDCSAFEGCDIRIMPDVHAGKGCTIGTTMTIKDKVVPGMVGVDIGCGMETVRLDAAAVDFEKLDDVIRQGIPSGRDIRKEPHEYAQLVDLDQLRCRDVLHLTRGRKSIGTLGGGNHFIEVDRGSDGSLYIVVHSGSRHLGYEVADYYQNEGFYSMLNAARFQIDEMIATLKREGRQKEINGRLTELKNQRAKNKPASKPLAYVEGKLFDDYIHDMKIIQKFAVINRKAMMDVILRGMGFKVLEKFTTIHNYIDTEHMILRKGAVSAMEGEKLLIPINMRDGSLICVGRGNPDWNWSAPHGAGRIMSRKAAFSTLSMEDYIESMDGIFSTSICYDTLDESPMAYKGMDHILKNIGPTCDVLDSIKPIYNFKAAE